MGPGHDHGHSPGARPGARGTATAAHRGRLRGALALTATVMVAELLGSLLTGSLALLADAGHMATDVVGLTMALVAVRFAARPPSQRRTFGLARAEIVAAVANALLLFGVGGYVLITAVPRFFEPVEVPGGPTLLFGGLGLAANLASLALLMRGQHDSLNVRGAFLEVTADALGSVAVIVAALVIALTGWTAADPVASVVIGLMIVPRTWKMFRESLDVLLEAAPKDVDMAEVRAHILALPGVVGLHDLHAWTITSGMPVLSAHVVVGRDVWDFAAHEKLLHDLQSCLGDHFDVAHCTFQLEPHGHAAHEAQLCH
ncbi:cation diffusion facilitator family transporter [Streptomyces sp. MST-110588]|uniref:cation diffusion facilitator family transporter n=1 Tax=Streptomyces sp. MST-110588 TaxID=2833628 RepID=UPI001F5D8AFB|nr:cation diffusion facilitator family transporter [Streptomyces sp. MST-110588]UNO43098.1 cation transporter [Streptomyces sp. MST-110588]